MIDSNTIGSRITWHRQKEGMKQAELAEELRSEPLPLVIVGDGAVLCEKALTESGLPCRLAPPQLVMQNAMSVALCAEEMCIRDSPSTAAFRPHSVLARISRAAVTDWGLAL